MKKTYSAFSKFFALAAVASLVLSSCSGDGKESSQQEASTPSSTTSSSASSEGSSEAAREPVTLEWYTNVNSVQPDAEMMMEEFSRYCQEKLNTTINLHMYDWGEYGTTLSTMITAGLNLDIVFAGAGIDYASYARRNAFLPIDEYLDTTLADTAAMFPDAAWDAVTVDGKIYGVPAYKDFSNRANFEANQTLIDDIGVPFPDGEWNTGFDLIDWLYEFKKARDAKYPEKADIPIMSQRDLGGWYTYEGALAAMNMTGGFGCEGMGDGEKVFNWYATPEYRKVCKTIRQLVKDGIMPFQDDFDPDGVYKQNGDLIGWFGSGLISLNEDANMPYYKTKLYVSNVVTQTTGGFTVGPQCISQKCANPERAAEVLNLVNTDQYAATILRYGVEGEHWTDENNDNIIELGERNSDSQNYGWYTWYGWQFGGLGVTKVPEGNPSNFTDLLQDLNNSANALGNVGFQFDTTDVANEVAACSNVINEYNGTLMKGQVDNIDELVDEFVAKLEANGSQKIIDACQKQLDEWRAANGK